MGNNGNGDAMSITVHGLDKAVAKLKKFGVDGKKALKEELEDTATTIEIGATQKAPTSIKGLIDKKVSNGGLFWRVGVVGEDPLPAYFEFGTGASAREILANYSEEIKEIARQFYINGQGTLVGKPYLFPTWLAETPKLVVNLEKRLTELAKR